MHYAVSFPVKLVEKYALLVCKIVGPKIRLCKFLTNIKSGQHLPPCFKQISNNYFQNCFHMGPKEQMNYSCTRAKLFAKIFKRNKLNVDLKSEN